MIMFINTVWHSTSTVEIECNGYVDAFTLLDIALVEIRFYLLTRAALYEFILLLLY